MSTADPRRLIDGFSHIDRGVHSGVRPNQLDRDQLSFAVNSVFRSGVPEQRPAIRERELDFPDDETASAFQDGLWQGGFTYFWADRSYLLASISGRFYIIDPTQGFSVRDGGIQSQPNQPQVWMEQAEMFVIRQDGGWSRPLIFDGVTVRESNIEAGEVPGGCMMKYALGRLWLVNPNRMDFIAGDLVFGPSGTLAYGYRDSVLKFTENEFIDLGGAFTVGDKILAMRNQATIDTTLGEGPLAVFFSGGAALVNAPFDRELWSQVEYPIQTIGQLSHGLRGQFSTTNVNNDIWGRADDGIRSFKAARRDMASWGDTPQSYEMDRVIKFDQVDLLEFGSSVLFDNRFLTTAAPFIVPLRGVCHRGMISLDFQQVSSIASNTPSELANTGSPAYDGLWTGLRILYACTLEINGVPRCFIWALNQQDKISLYELTRSELFDGDGTQRVEWSFETPAYRYGFEGINANYMRLMGLNLWRSELVGQVDFSVSYRADHHPLWNELEQWQWSDCASQNCFLTPCGECPSVPQYRAPKRLSVPDDDCEPASNKLARHGFQFQFKVDITGPASLDRLRPWTYDFPEARYDTFCESEECPSTPLPGQPSTIFDYEINSS